MDWFPVASHSISSLRQPRVLASWTPPWYQRLAHRQLHREPGDRLLTGLRGAPSKVFSLLFSRLLHNSLKNIYFSFALFPDFHPFSFFYPLLSERRRTTNCRLSSRNWKPYCRNVCMIAATVGSLPRFQILLIFVQKTVIFSLT